MSKCRGTISQLPLISPSSTMSSTHHRPRLRGIIGTSLRTPLQPHPPPSTFRHQPQLPLLTSFLSAVLIMKFGSWNTRDVPRRRRILQFNTALQVSSSEFSARISGRLRREGRSLPGEIDDLSGDSTFPSHCVGLIWLCDGDA